MFSLSDIVIMKFFFHLFHFKSEPARSRHEQPLRISWPVFHQQRWDYTPMHMELEASNPSFSSRPMYMKVGSSSFLPPRRGREGFVQASYANAPIDERYGTFSSSKQLERKDSAHPSPLSFERNGSVRSLHASVSTNLPVCMKAEPSPEVQWTSSVSLPLFQNGSNESIIHLGYD